LKLDTMEAVAEYQGKVTPDVFSGILLNAGSEYGNCMIVVENNSVGFTVLDKLKEAGYPNVYHSIKSSHEYVDQLEAEYRNSAVPGFTTSLKTRPMIIAKMEEFIRNKLVKIYSSRLVDEFKTFIWNNGRPQAMRSYHDDLIIAFAIGCWVRDTVFSENQREMQYKKAILNSITKTDTILNTTISGMQGYIPVKNNNAAKKDIEQRKEFLWLFKG